MFSMQWRQEELAGGMTGLEKTTESFKAMMNSICNFLSLTMETATDFGGVLPTLDLSIWVREDNKTMYMFYSKPMASNMVLQSRSAMPENMKIATLNQEVIRRMVNTSEDLDDSIRLEVVDNYARKIINSGYGLNQTRNVMVGGLKGYERKLKLSKDVTNPKWQPLHPPASFNIQARRKKKILEKNNWFKKTSSHEEEKTDAEQTPSYKEEDGQPTGREVSHPSSLQEHQTVGKSNVMIHKDSKNNFKTNKNKNKNK